ncbi:hypothetical protein Dda_4880 [Drechslerella dactyloides]|uniref:Uncharacterized protein n=1 Tax=Drechslerella dactyloides TaxID=74499 RepID=A0AAD6IXS6_DREDA|nr:hypothetical protein Dda_4880 [Drechslerella dactyloides]
MDPQDILLSATRNKKLGGRQNRKRQTGLWADRGVVFVERNGGGEMQVDVHEQEQEEQEQEFKLRQGRID